MLDQKIKLVKILQELTESEPKVYPRHQNPILDLTILSTFSAVY